MVRLVFFADKYNIEEYDRVPLPADIYNSEGAIMARKGQKLPKQRLLNTYIYDDDVAPDILEDIDLDGDISRLIAVLEETEETVENYDEIPSDAKPGGIPYTMTEKFSEESAEEIDEKLNRIGFEPLQDVKMNLRRNVYNMKEIFQKEIIGGTAKLASKNNYKLSNSIAQYLDTILDKNLYASDYMDMINAVRNPENYLSFSHSCSVAFYSLSIIKKLKILKEDFFNGYDMGKWIPMKTAKHPDSTEVLLLPNNLLRYIDHQKNIIRIKYSEAVRSVLYEKLHDIMYEYAALDRTKKYPSMQISFDEENRRLITIAALNHDIGKICIPNEVLNKNKKLSLEEARLMERHPALSVAKLKELGIDNQALFAYILGHHRLSPERGYPPFEKCPPMNRKLLPFRIFLTASGPQSSGERRDSRKLHCHILLHYMKMVVLIFPFTWRQCIPSRNTIICM